MQDAMLREFKRFPDLLGQIAGEVVRESASLATLASWNSKQGPRTQRAMRLLLWAFGSQTHLKGEQAAAEGSAIEVHSAVRIQTRQRGNLVRKMTDFGKRKPHRPKVGTKATLILSRQVFGYKFHLNQRAELGRKYPTWEDLMIWAVLSGEQQLATVLWERTASPLRAAVLASQMCSKLAANPRHKNDTKPLQETSAFYESLACSLLDMIHDPADALPLLTLTPWVGRCEDATLVHKLRKMPPDSKEQLVETLLGSRVRMIKLWRHSVLEMSTGADGNHEGTCERLAAHRHAQFVLDEYFRGDYPGSTVAIPFGTSITAIFLQAIFWFLPGCFVEMIPVKAQPNVEPSISAMDAMKNMPFEKYLGRNLAAHRKIIGRQIGRKGRPFFSSMRNAGGVSKSGGLAPRASTSSSKPDEDRDEGMVPGKHLTSSSYRTRPSDSSHAVSEARVSQNALLRKIESFLGIGGSRDEWDPDLVVVGHQAAEAAECDDHFSQMSMVQAICDNVSSGRWIQFYAVPKVKYTSYLVFYIAYIIILSGFLLVHKRWRATPPGSPQNRRSPTALRLPYCLPANMPTASTFHLLPPRSPHTARPVGTKVWKTLSGAHGCVGMVTSAGWR
jgi:hypothetical protein